MLVRFTVIMCACTFVEMLKLGGGGGLHAQLNNPDDCDDEYEKPEDESKDLLPDVTKGVGGIHLPSGDDDQYCKGDENPNDGNSSPDDHKEVPPFEKTVPVKGGEGDNEKPPEEEKSSVTEKAPDSNNDEEENKKVSVHIPIPVTIETPHTSEDGEEDKKVSVHIPIPVTIETPHTSEDGEEPKIDPELEKQYSPVLWAKNYHGSSSVVIEEYTQIAIKESEDVNRTVPHKSNIQYGKGESELLDIYGGESFPEGTELIVLVHGFILDYTKELASFVVKPFYENGVIVVMPDYDKPPKANLGEIMIELKELANFAFSLAVKYKCRSLWIGGHSIVGAQGVAQLLFDDYLKTVDAEMVKLFKGIILVSGIYDLRPVVHTSLYTTLGLTKESVEQYSLILKDNQLNIARNLSLKVLIVSAEYDSPAFQGQTTEFTKFLTDNKINHEYAEIEGEDHYSETLNLYYSDYVLTQKILHLIQFDEDIKDKEKYCSRVEKYCSVKNK